MNKIKHKHTRPTSSLTYEQQLSEGCGTQPLSAATVTTGKRTWRKLLLYSTVTALLASSGALPVAVAHGAATAITASASTVPNTTIQNGGNRAYEHIVFLGDSLTVGYEPDRSAADYDGFTTRLKEQELFRGRASVDNEGILGLTSSGLHQYVNAITAGKKVSTSDIQSNLPGKARTLDGAQAAAHIRSANLITITIGGNDFLNALGSLTALPQDLSGLNLEPVLNGYENNLTAVLDQLSALNPAATIVIADQYQPVPAVSGAGVYRGLNELAAQFSAIVDHTAAEYVAQGKDVRVAHISEAFKGNELGMTHIAQGDIHPNASGYQAIALAFSRAIWGDNGYRTPPSTVNATDRTIIYTNGQLLKSSALPIVRNGRTYVALRDVTTALGARVAWSDKTKQATVTGSKQITIPLNGYAIRVNGQNVPTDAPAFMQTGKTYVPLALLADEFGYDVQYVKRWKAVFIRQ
ncbi:stalk domain-containing protein [Paenibacillus sp. SGZ-1009]|uniref:stalk domain-containing protein n=1 Tax=Paenibacillus campi TaxID=3106031 RepID=UPI002AFF6D9E|nr:stalk domain-containing protein [Paenibacillus sp. SGZ-1009]